MGNIRILYDNAADRAILSASGSVGELVPANLRTDIKSQCWRAPGTTATLTVEWPEAETVSCVCLAFCNLSNAARWRIRGFYDPDDAVPSIDTGFIDALPGIPLAAHAVGDLPLGANATACGGHRYAVAWFAPQILRKIVIDIDDEYAKSDFIDIGRLIAGPHWAPEYNPPYGVTVGFVDNSKSERNEAGDLISDQQPRYRQIGIQLDWLGAMDRNRMMWIYQHCGTTRPMLVSLTPLSADPLQRQMYTLWGKARAGGSVTWKYLPAWATQLEIEEV